MLERCVILALIAGGVVLVFYVIRPGMVFIMKIRTGALEVSRGKAPRGFVEDCESIVRDFNLHRGTIIRVKRGRTTLLRFSRNIP